MPPCDLVVIAGDLSPYAWKQAPSQVPWLEAVFAPWLERIAAEAGAPVAGIAGNRDFALWWDRRALEKLPWTYLCDSEASVAGARLYGSPWCPRRRLKPKADEPQPPSPALPEGAAVPHWPPRGRGGVFMASGEDELEGALRGDPGRPRHPRHAHAARGARRSHPGAASAWARARCSPRSSCGEPPLALFGHIHEGRAEPTRAGRTLCANSAICDRWFERRNQPWLFDLDVSAGTAELARDA